MPALRWGAMSLRFAARVVVVLAFGLLLSCEGSRPAGTDASDLDGNRRLGREVIPLHYTLDLRIDPGRDRFSGTAMIQVEVASPTRRIVMHGSDLDVREAEIESGDAVVQARIENGRNGGLALELASRVPAGPATLRLAWDGPLPESPFGLYRVEVDGTWYAFTQFEPLEARKAFPSFDQPEFKTPFAVTLWVPPGQTALSGGPLVERRSEPGAEVFVFAETQPLPTYLVAFAVGEFDIVDGGGTPPLRVVARRGQGQLTGYVLERSPVIVSWLTDYFDHPFPFAKLDLVAVPNFGAGAMENVGLVTFRERFLLFDPATAPIWSRYAAQSIVSHELAHMWYGNLVTMAWWDDLWLNESFATWMAAKVLEDIDPELESRLDGVAYAQGTMQLDSKRDARQIRQPIHDGGDVYNAFDGITYGKGAAVLRMVEAWIGEDAFRTAVRAYMQDHAYGSGGTDELLAALETASGQPVAETLANFLDQPGTPLVQVELSCEDASAPRLRLQQTRALPAGSEAAVGEPWTVPLCVGLGTGDPDAPRVRECFRLAGREQEVALESVRSCPVFVHPNAGERGYYRWDLPPSARVALVRDHLSVLETAEIVAITGHYWALLEAERLDVADFVTVLRLLAPQRSRQVTRAVADAYWTLYDVGLPDEASPVGTAFASEVRGALGPHLDRIGVLPQAGESPDARLRRGPLVEALAVMGRDPWILARARTVASAFVADPATADEEVVGLLLPVAAAQGDAALWDALVAIALDPPSPVVREIVVESLGRFQDPDLLSKSLDLVVDGRLRGQDYRTLARGIRPTERPVAWAWLTGHYAQLVARLGPMTSTGLPHLASGLCSPEDVERVAAFFASRDEAPSGTARNVRLVSEDIARCARLRATVEPALEGLFVGS